jgi:hypothetical protein
MTDIQSSPHTEMPPSQARTFSRGAGACRCHQSCRFAMVARPLLFLSTLHSPHYRSDRDSDDQPELAAQCAPDNARIAMSTTRPIWLSLAHSALVDALLQAICPDPQTLTAQMEFSEVGRGTKFSSDHLPAGRVSGRWHPVCVVRLKAVRVDDGLMKRDAAWRAMEGRRVRRLTASTHWG